MKQVFDTDGNDITAATLAYLLSTPTENLVVRDCFFIGPPVNYPSTGQYDPVDTSNYGAYPLVDGDYPVSYQGITYQPFSIEKDKLEYNINFEASKLNLTLRPREYPNLVGALTNYTRGDGTSFSQNLSVNPPYTDQYITIFGNTPEGIQAFQTMRQGIASTDFYFAPVTMTRMFLSAPTPGGAVMFRGRVSDITIDRFEIKMTVASLMEVFTQKVPTQLIEPGNRWLAWNFDPTPNSHGSLGSTWSFTELGSDDFTRADENPLSQGGNWTSGGDYLQVVSDVCVSASYTPGEAYYTGVTLPDDQYVTVTIANITPNPPDVVNPTLIAEVRVNPSVPNTGYKVFIAGDDIFLTSGSTVIGPPAGIIAPVNSGDQVTLVAIGTNITVLRNGNPIISVTDSTYTSGSAALAMESGPGNISGFSYFECGSASGSPGSPGGGYNWFTSNGGTILIG